MSKNYEIIHYIRDNAKDLDEELVNTLTRMFTRLDERHCYSSALSTSITLCTAFKYFGYYPKLILGTIQYQGLSYPHAWMELDDKIFDIATYEDIQHQPVLKDRELTLINPIINISYEDAAEHIEYYPFQFGETWPMANMKRVVDKTWKEYAEEAPYFDMIGDLCYILEISETPDNVDLLKAIMSMEYIKDVEEEESDG